MTALVFAPLRNGKWPDGRQKADANEFRNEAHAFNKAHGFNDQVYIFDNALDKADRRAVLLRALTALQPGELTVLALFCHGHADGVQVGFSNAHARGLAKQLKVVSAESLTVALYCCSTGADDDKSEADERQPGPGGDGGFADRLRDELNEAGVHATVYGHSVKGHTTRLPFVRRFGPEKREGGDWLVEPNSELWAAWQRALHGTDMRFRYPFMTVEAIHAELASES